MQPVPPPFTEGESSSHLFRTTLLDACVCAPQAKTGVRQSVITAGSRDVEIWGACSAATSDDNPYSFNCNHDRVQAGQSVVFPTRPLLNYNPSDGVHLHARARSHTPHIDADGPWQDVSLVPCECNANAHT